MLRVLQGKTDGGQDTTPTNISSIPPTTEQKDPVPQTTVGQAPPDLMITPGAEADPMACLKEG